MTTTKEPTKDIWNELRKPFPRESVGKLPKGGIQLDYVGHAAVTDRLNTVDPTWTWEPMAYDPSGLPQFSVGEPQFGKPTKGLWIRLSIGGVTRPGYGDGKNEKEAIGDALRNAAMRFGVALDLWSKDELESNVEHPENKNYKPTREVYNPDQFPKEPIKDVRDDDAITDNQLKDLVALLDRKGVVDKNDQGHILRAFAKSNFSLATARDMTRAQAAEITMTIEMMDNQALLRLTEAP